MRKRSSELFMFTCLLFSLSLIIASETKITSLKEIMKPGAFAVNNEGLYISQDYSIYIYALKDHQFIKNFGRKGEGPGEFVSIMSIYANDRVVAVTRCGGVSVFSTDGLFKYSFHSGPFDDRFIPLGKKFVGGDFISVGNSKFTTFNIINENFKVEKEFYRYDAKVNDEVDLIRESPSFCVCGDKILFYDEDSVVHILNGKGELIRKLDPKLMIDNIPVTSNDEERYITFYKTYSKKTKEIYLYVKNRIRFNSSFPYIQKFAAVDNKIYIMTYKMIGKCYEILVYGFDGKFIRKVPIPVIFDKYMVETSPWLIKNDKVYQLIENDDAECWDLHVTPF